MKKAFVFFLVLILFLSATSCTGTFSQTKLNKPIPIPSDGIIEKEMLEQIRSDNAIATFTGRSNEIEYEWIIFGSELTDPKAVNLSVEITRTDKGILLAFSQDSLGFPAQLAIHLNEKWTVDGAAAYLNGTPVFSVSVTGSKTSILNVSVEDILAPWEIRPQTAKSNETTDATEQTTTTSSTDRPTTSSATPGTATDSASSQISDTDKNSDTGTISDTESTSSSTVDRPVSTGQDGKGQYETDPVPEGKPLPVEPEDQEVNKGKSYTCTFSIECSTILNNLAKLDPDKLELIPVNGVILAPTKVTFYEGESVFDVLKRVCKEQNIHLEFSWTPIYNSAYIEGIHNLYEFDCGELSGWMYRVNGWYPNYGCSRYQLVDGETVEWRYTCDLGRDVGEDRLGQ